MDPEKLKVVDLRKELQQRGLDTKGVKAALVKRLKDALDAESATAGDSEPEVLSAGDKEADEELQSPTKELSKSPSPKRELATSPKKEVSPSPQKVPIPKECPLISKSSPEKVNQELPITPKEDDQAETEKDDEQIEVECHGAKRKRDEDDEEGNEGREKKRREAEDAVENLEEPAIETPVRERPPPREDEPEIDLAKTLLSWVDSDLNLKIDNKTFLSAKPLTEGCFGYVWAGARATHGISSGKVCFEVKLTEELKWDDLADRMLERLDKSHRERFRFDRRKTESVKPEGDEDMPAEVKEKPEDCQEKLQGEEEKKDEEVNLDENSEGNKEETPENGNGDGKMDTDDVEENKQGESENSEKEEDVPTNEVAIEQIEKTEGEEAEIENEESEENQVKPEDKSHLPPIPTHLFRVGFSLPETSLQLGEVKYSYAYESTGKFISENNFEDYGISFGVGDVVGAYLNIDDENVTITYTVNGILQPTAATVPRSELPQENFNLFPHILCRNYAYEVNFGDKEPWFPHPDLLQTYQFLEQAEHKVEGPQRPEKREDCEVFLLIGLPGSGKTHWVKNHVAANLDKRYTVIGNNPLFDRMTVQGEPIKSHFRGSWKILVDRIQKCLNQLTDQAALRRRNYVIDQTNVFPNAQKRKLRNFEGFNRKAVIVVCDDEEHARRQLDQENDYGKSVPESTMYDLKAQMELPQKCEWVEELIFPDLNEEEAKQKVKEYNEEANKKGYFKRWQHNRKHQRNFRPGLRRPYGPRGGRFGRYPPQRPGWNRPPPAWGRKDMRGPPGQFRQGGPVGWRQPQRDQNRPRDNRIGGGYGGGRNNQGGYRNNQGGQRNNSWQGNGAGAWGSGSNQGGWNTSMYGSHGYGAWNQNNQTAQQQAAWKYGATQNTYGNQGQRGYGGSQGNQGYGTQAGYAAQGDYGQGYGQSWNYYGQYGQQQGWGNQQKKQ
ncbi:heterogeneous nuclear ribonucleoprotein U-like protein 2 [Euwallacea fornicatus]|uniref:heterogeneous nuclear ribonucleoprotein U-like protein 2 n=1 Tax=Euwallacea fornicatus TaxID=995702 RepID=UPI00338E0A60